MDHFIIGKELSAHSDVSYETKLKKCKRKCLFEPISENEIDKAYAELLSGLSQEFARASARLSKGVIENGRVRLSQICGKYFRIMGFSLDGSSYLHPEEALYLAECNKIQVLVSGLPLSIQELYDQLLNNETYPYYLAYSRLSRLNFSLRKRANFDLKSYYHCVTDKLFKIPKSINVSITTYPLLNHEYRKPIGKRKFIDFQPLINHNKIHSITDLMHNLQEIVQPASDKSVKSTKDLNLLYDIYGNNHTEKRRIINFSKRSPPHPDYVLSVLSPKQIYPDIDSKSLVKVGLQPDTSVLICMVDGCDVSFYITNCFVIPNINFQVTRQENMTWI
ncbi:unnamed protein product [Schistosoma intercalatum]|nr:unnamed protein product [Schistosoma intercalatum]